MPIYRYKCKCGGAQDQFLKTDVDAVVLTCQSCLKGVTARQVRDKAAVFSENNEVHGIYQRNTHA